MSDLINRSGISTINFLDKLKTNNKMENEDKRYYVRQYERALSNLQRNKIVREARAEVINKFIELLESGSTWFVMDKYPVQLCGPDGKTYKGWLGREKAKKDFKKLLKENETCTWNHKEEKSKIYNILITGSSYREGKFIICKNYKEACEKAGIKYYPENDDDLMEEEKVGS
ncbi:MAG: hypothetical protein IJ880_17695 [Bacilli bacterium]|nr:hypothetical protein [Bacilli bacterium]